MLIMVLGGANLARAEEELRPITFGRVLFYPSATVSFSQDDNIRRTTPQDPFFGEISSSIREITPGLRFEVPFEKSSLEFSYRGVSREFSAPELSGASGLSHYLDLDTRFQVTPAIRLDVSDHLVRGISELPEIDPGGELRFGTRPFLTQDLAATLALQVGPIQGVEIGGSFNTTRFDDGESGELFFDYRERRMFGRYVLAAGPSTALFAAAAVQEVNQNRGVLEVTPTDFQRRAFGLGFRRQMTRDLTSEFQASYSATRFDQGGVSPFRGLTVEGNLNDRLGARSTVGLRLRRDVRPSFFNVNALYVNEMAQVSLEHRLGRRIRVQIQGTVQRNEYPEAVRTKVSGPADEPFDGNGDGIIDVYESLVPSEGVRRRDRIRDESLTLGYDFFRGLRLDLAYRRSRARSNIMAKSLDVIFQPFDYNSHAVTAVLAVGWR